MSVIQSMTTEQLLELRQQAKQELNNRDGGQPDFTKMTPNEFYWYTKDLARENEKEKQEAARLARMKQLAEQEPQEDE